MPLAVRVQPWQGPADFGSYPRCIVYWQMNISLVDSSSFVVLFVDRCWSITELPLRRLGATFFVSKYNKHFVLRLCADLWITVAGGACKPECNSCCCTPQWSHYLDLDALSDTLPSNPEPLRVWAGTECAHRLCILNQNISVMHQAAEPVCNQIQ